MPKVRKRKLKSIQEIEDFANKSDDALKKAIPKMVRTTVAFTIEEHQKLKSIAKEQGRTLQSQIRQMLRDLLH